MTVMPTGSGFFSLASGGAVGASFFLFVYYLDYARTSLANDSNTAKKGGERQFNGLVDVYNKTLKSDGITGLYCGFIISYVGNMQDSFFVAYALGWLITNGVGLASYPIDTVRRGMMMTSGEAVKYNSSIDAFQQIVKEGAKTLFKGDGANI